MKIDLNREWDNEKIKEFLLELGSNKGYCPCRIAQSEDNKCPCKEFREQETAGECYCGLFVKVED